MVSWSPPRPPIASSRLRAFSLIELITVVAIISVVMAFLAPAYTSIKSSNDLVQATTGVAGMMERARSYAMANNLYVYVGIAEVNADVPADTVPQTPANSNGGGRLALAAVALRDGSRGYDLLSTLQNPAWANYNRGASLISLGNVEVYENVHLASSLGTIPPTGPMARPSVSSAYRLGDPSCQSVTPFSWPLSADIGAGQYAFNKVIQFDPQGVARIQYPDNQDIIVEHMEIDLQQTHGSLVPALPAAATGAIAAVQIDGMTGAVRVFRP